MLLEYNKFDFIFDELSGKKIYFLCKMGWAGDVLIDTAARQMFNHYNVEETNIEDADFIIESGGGNLGNGYDEAHSRRQKIFEIAEKLNKKVIILPKSFYGFNQEFPSCVYKVYARDCFTRSLIPFSILAPDLALGYNYSYEIKSPKYDLGLFLRDDENLFNGRIYEGNIGDPLLLIRQRNNCFLDLFDLAMDYETICTDRLHFAICSLVLGRKVILMPNSYYKNYGMWLTWLRNLGCSWAHSPDEIVKNYR